MLYKKLKQPNDAHFLYWFPICYRAQAIHPGHTTCQKAKSGKELLRSLEILQTSSLQKTNLQISSPRPIRCTDKVYSLKNIVSVQSFWCWWTSALLALVLGCLTLRQIPQNKLCKALRNVALYVFDPWNSHECEIMENKACILSDFPIPFQLMPRSSSQET